MPSTERSAPRPWIRVLAALLALGLLAAACGGSDPDESSGGSGGTDQDGDVDKYGGVLKFGLEAESPDGYTMGSAQCAASCGMVANAIYDAMTRVDENGVTQPELLESFTTEDGGVTWTLVVREGIEFHNGEPLDAEAIKANLEGVKNGSVTAATLVNLATVEVVDERTVKVSMTVDGQPTSDPFPWATFPDFLTGQLGYVAAPAQLEDVEQGKNNPIGTGPFVFDAWDVGSVLKVTRNADYWKKSPDGDQLPYLDGVEFYIRPEGQTRKADLETGQLDALHTSDSLLLDDIQKVDDIETLLQKDYLPTSYLMLNVFEGPLADRAVRRALAKATNRQQIADLRGAGLVEVANGPYGPGAIGYLEATGFPEYDLEAAKSEVAAYEKDNGPLTIEITTTSDTNNKATVDLVAAQWKEAGVDVKINQVDQARIITIALFGNFEVTLWRNHGATQPDQEFVWWHSALAPDPGKVGINFGRIRDDVIDAQLLAGRTTQDTDDQRAAAEAINKRFGDQAFNIWLSWTLWAMAVDPAVEDLTVGYVGAGSERAQPQLGGVVRLENAYLSE